MIDWWLICDVMMVEGIAARSRRNINHTSLCSCAIRLMRCLVWFFPLAPIKGTHAARRTFDSVGGYYGLMFTVISVAFLVRWLIICTDRKKEMT